MTNQTLIVERTYNAPIEKVWGALTDNKQMKQWYFDIADFKPEIGFEFSFSATNDVNTYVHLCKVTDVIAGSRLAYTWRYADRPGITEVTFELFAEGDRTRLKLSHSGIETLAGNGPDFEVKSFTEGWNYILGKSLKEYLEGAPAA